jgi:hypothetical protein
VQLLRLFDNPPNLFFVFVGQARKLILIEQGMTGELRELRSNYRNSLLKGSERLAIRAELLADHA